MGIQTINPATGELIHDYPEMSGAEVASIIDTTHAVYEAWRRTGFDERAQKMRKLADLCRAKKREMAELMANEMGKPITQGMAEAEKCAWACEYYAENSQAHLADRLIKTEKLKSKVSYRPRGIVFAIMPWNFPFWQVFRFLCPCLMAGNAGLLSHAPISTGTSLMIEAMVEEAGFPKNLFRSLIVNNDVAAEVIGNTNVTAVTLTGSERAGKAVASEAGQHLKKVVLELGGSDPYVILHDADLEKAATACVRSRLSNTGQVCIAAKRLIVVESVLEKFERLVIEKAKAYQMGDPLDEKTNFGPMARADLREQLHKQVQTAIKEGAQLVMGGEMPEGVGFYYPVTVLCNVTPDMTPFKEELFGPVIAIIPAKDEDEALRMANETPYGLAGAVFTQDLERGEHIATNVIESGCVAVNNFVGSDPRLPFGGIKLSGFGRELSEEGIREFVNVKTVCVE